MTKKGDKSVIYCSKCQINTPHTYKTSVSGDFFGKLVGKTFRDMGSGWYCDNCGKKNIPQNYEEALEEELEGDYY
jgi:hypothetical protein